MSTPDLSRLQAAIVDLDGTLVDTLPDFTVALNATLSELQLAPLSAERIAALVGKGSEHLVRSVLAAAQGRADQFDAAWRSYQRQYEAVNGRHARVYPGAREGLRKLRGRGLRMACVTNKPLAFAQALLAKTGLAGEFELVFGGDSFAKRKPHPMPLLMACSALGVEPSRTLVVGDSVNDAQAARAAGCPVVLVSYGYNHGQPVQKVDADAVLDSIADLRA
ncbi:phosphoglycolate phosphatase [Ramlibacter sp. AN1015]|uniref:phosphoglycolate phosphatase n=1 Tax=Ramlibacter sp. AN1015 TaxID=3133428 RepID=UPI0030BC8590